MFKDKSYKPYYIFFAICSFFILYAFCISTPKEILSGLYSILISQDVLITDYIKVAGLGGALVNVAIVGISCTLVMMFAKIKPSGAIIMAIWLNIGFAFFGKNFYNIWPVMLGVYIYSRVKDKPFSNFSLVFLLSTSLAPIVTQTIHTDGSSDSVFIAFVFGILSGIVSGFILPPIAAASNRVHNGYNLYNVGFASGLIGTLYLSILKTFDIVMSSNYIWGSGFDNYSIMIVLGACIILLIFGIKEKGIQGFLDIKKIMNHSGRLVSDFYLLYHESVYINMAIIGLFACLVSKLIGLNLNGPVIGGIFTIIGFGAFGKHIKNIYPIMIGAILAAFLKQEPLNNGSNSLAILFSTGLAPIAGQFGVIAGIISGFLHVTMVSSIGYLHQGLNLYNNGYAAGFTALIVVPVITSLRKDLSDEF